VLTFGDRHTGSENAVCEDDDEASCTVAVAQWTGGDTHKKQLLKEFFCSFSSASLSPTLRHQVFAC